MGQKLNFRYSKVVVQNADRLFVGFVGVFHLIGVDFRHCQIFGGEGQVELPLQSFQHDRYLSNKIDKQGDAQAIDEVGKHGADNGDQNIGFYGGGVLFRQHLHIGHGVGSGAHTEAADTGGEDCRVVVSPHDVVDHKIGKGGHKQHLTCQQEQQRQSQLGQRVIMAMPRNRDRQMPPMSLISPIWMLK